MAVAEKFRNRANDVRMDAQDAVNRVRADQTLRPEIAHQRIRDIQEQQRVTLAALNDESNRFNQDRVRKAGQKAWGVPASETLSHRQALAQVGGVTDPRILQRHLNEAVETGDATLAKACAYTAHRTPGCGEVLNSYVTAYPEAAGPINDIAVAQSSNGGVEGLDIVHLLAFAAPTY
jgi:hypothetical protein